MNNGNGVHAWICDNQSCWNYEGWATGAENDTSESCYGGRATCTRGKICDACGQEYGSSLGFEDHDWGAWEKVDETTHKHTCQRQGCGASEIGNHAGGTATCTTKAVCVVCGLEYGDYGHTPSEPVEENIQPATCKQSGSYDKVTYCMVCGNVASRETIALGKLQHTPGQPVEENIHPATCTETGLTEGKHCSRCNAVLTPQEEVPALGHDYHATERTITRVRYTVGEEQSPLGLPLPLF